MFDLLLITCLIGATLLLYTHIFEMKIVFDAFFAKISPETEFQKFKNVIISSGLLVVATSGITACLALLDQSLSILPTGLSNLLDKLVPIVSICGFFLFLITLILFSIIFIKRSL